MLVRKVVTMVVIPTVTAVVAGVVRMASERHQKMGPAQRFGKVIDEALGLAKGKHMAKEPLAKMWWTMPLCRAMWVK